MNIQHSTLNIQRRSSILTGILTMIGLLLPAIVPAIAAITEDTVCVTGTRINGAHYRQLTVITAEELAATPVTTIGEALALSPSIDVQSRGLPGAQADITMRGGMFEQVLILVDGVRLNSAQTGHLHAALPVALGMIDRIEVMPGQGSSVYGSDAANGVINIITKNNAAGISSSASYGEYGTGRVTAGLGISSGNLNHTVSLERAQSDGYSYDTDYANTFINLKTRGSYNRGILEATVLYGDREFGAYDFYTPGKDYPSKEWTRSTGVTVRNRHLAGDIRIESFISARQQTDHFVLFVDNPAIYENEHTARYLEAESYISLPVLERATLIGGFNYRLNHLASTKLHDHHQNRQSIFTELKQPVSDRLSITAGARLEYSGSGASVSPSLNVRMKFNERFTVYGQGGMATRTPSYTELFYFDPVNFSNPDLKDEKTLAAEAGADYEFVNGISARLVLHATRYMDFIDWTGISATGPWYANNVSSMLVTGIEPELRFNRGYLQAALRASFIMRDQTETYLSKYAFRFPETAVTFSGNTPLGTRLALGIMTSYRQRTGEEGYLLADLRMTGRLALGTSLFIDVKNITDKHYEDVPGVPQPGRIVMGGIEYRR